MTIDFAAARRHMVDGQIRTYNVVDERVLEAFASVPRELFMPPSERSRAYLDIDTTVSHGRFMMQPMILARLIQAAEPEPDSVALVVGAGTGYSAAILGKLVRSVIALESDQGLAGFAGEALARAGADNVRVVVGAHELGDRKYAPYDVILIDGAIAEAPKALLDQLSEGGRLAAVVLRRTVGKATVWQKNRAGVAPRPLFDATARLLPGLVPEPRFVF
jgi:protein-L-isoaspartate(D-aspartate) O-methyltransferase